MDKCVLLSDIFEKKKEELKLSSWYIQLFN